MHRTSQVSRCSTVQLSFPFQLGFLSFLPCLTFQNVRQSVQHSLYQGETTMAQRHQRGWLKKEKRARGETWVLFFRTTRKSDGRRVENKVPIGLVHNLPDESRAWAEVERLHVPTDQVDVRRGLTFGDLAQQILSPEQAYAIVRNLRVPERTLTLLAAGTGLRISECLGLQWHDVNFADGMIHVRRTWTCGQVGLPKSKASKGPVPLHPLLAEFMLLWKQKTTYSQSGDWVFPSTRLNGKQPRVANMLVEDHLRPAAVKAGILSSHLDNDGRLVDDDPRRFGFHNLRHSLASFLIRIRTDPKTMQTCFATA